MKIKCEDCILKCEDRKTNFGWSDPHVRVLDDTDFLKPNGQSRNLNIYDHNTMICISELLSHGNHYNLISHCIMSQLIMSLLTPWSHISGLHDLRVVLSCM